jgi:hypothetical protein
MEGNTVEMLQNLSLELGTLSKGVKQEGVTHVCSLLMLETVDIALNKVLLLPGKTLDALQLFTSSLKAQDVKPHIIVVNVLQKHSAM